MDQRFLRILFTVIVLDLLCLFVLAGFLLAGISARLLPLVVAYLFVFTIVMFRFYEPARRSWWQTAIKICAFGVLAIVVPTLIMSAQRAGGWQAYIAVVFAIVVGGAALHASQLPISSDPERRMRPVPPTPGNEETGMGNQK